MQILPHFFCIYSAGGGRLFGGIGERGEKGRVNPGGVRSIKNQRNVYNTTYYIVYVCVLSFFRVHPWVILGGFLGGLLV